MTEAKDVLVARLGLKLDCLTLGRPDEAPEASRLACEGVGLEQHPQTTLSLARPGIGIRERTAWMCCLLLGLLGFFPGASRAAEKGMLYIKTEPAGAIVTIAGQEKGKTPLLVRDLPVGYVEISLALPGVVSEIAVASVVANTVTKVNHVFDIPKASLTVITEPLEAEVYVDRTKRGNSPVTIGDLEAGPHELTVYLPGYERTSREVKLPPGGEEIVEIKLAKAAARAVEETVDPAVVALLLKREMGSFDELVRKRDCAGAAKFASARASAPKNAPIAATMREAAKVAELLAKRGRMVRDSLQGRVGGKVAINTSAGPRRGKLKKVTDDGIEISTEIKINGRVMGSSEFKVEWKDLTFQQEEELADGWGDGDPNGDIAKAYLAVQRDDAAEAKRLLEASSGDLAGYLLGKAPKAAEPEAPPPGPAVSRRKEQLPQMVTGPLVVGGPDVVLVSLVDVTVTGGGMLTIRPGTRLEFGPGRGLITEGRLSARGEPGQPVEFTAIDRRRPWGGIKVQKFGQPVDLSWCRISFAEQGFWIRGGKNTSIRNCAFVANGVGMDLGLEGARISDTAVVSSRGDGVLAHDDYRSNWERVTISNSGGIGYHGVFKGWPIMKSCEITANRGGGLKCEKGGARYRGRPEVSDCNIFGNGQFDIWCDQPESYDFRRVHTGEAASRLLSRNPAAVLPNIRDRRTTGNQRTGLVVIIDPPLMPLPGAGAPDSVLEMTKADPGRSARPSQVVRPQVDTGKIDHGTVDRGSGSRTYPVYVSFSGRSLPGWCIFDGKKLAVDGEGKLLNVPARIDLPAGEGRILLVKRGMADIPVGVDVKPTSTGNAVTAPAKSQAGVSSFDKCRLATVVGRWQRLDNYGKPSDRLEVIYANGTLAHVPNPNLPNPPPNGTFVFSADDTTITLDCVSRNWPFKLWVNGEGGLNGPYRWKFVRATDGPVR